MLIFSDIQYILLRKLSSTVIKENGKSIQPNSVGKHAILCFQIVQQYAWPPTGWKNYSHLDKQNLLTNPENNPVNTAFGQAIPTS